MATTNTLVVEPDQQSSLSQLASAQLRSPEFLLREAIDEYLARQTADEAFYAAGQAAWEDYKATGLHLTDDEMKAWMKQLKADPKAPMPECHT